MEGAPTTRRKFVGAMGGLPALAAGSAAWPRPPLLAGADLGLARAFIHLNTASAGPTPERVLARAIDAWRRIEADPVRMSYSPEPDSVVSAADGVRAKAAALTGCTPDEILLTRGTTHGITTVAHGIRLKQGDHVLLTDQEHEGGETGWLHRANRDGVIIDRINIPIGDSDTAAILRRFEAGIGPRTRAISVSHVLSPTGLRMPVAEIAELAHRRGALCIVDGAQAAGQIKVELKALGCDAYATSGHKWLMGPKGTGFLYISKAADDAIQPAEWLLSRHYGSNSAGLSPMTLDVGLGEAIDRLAAIGMPRLEQHNLALRNRIYQEFARIGALELVSPPPGPLATALVAARLPKTIDSKELVKRMHDRHQVIIKMAEKRWFNGIRFSPHIFNDEAQIDTALAALRIELEAFSRS